MHGVNKLLGIDYGAKRVGLALSDESGHFAFPYEVLINTPKLVEQVVKICQQEQVTQVVLGESKDFKGQSNPIMKQIETFKKQLAEASGLPVEYEPEFLTSAEAERIQGKTDEHDASAAALILKSYIDRTTS